MNLTLLQDAAFDAEPLSLAEAKLYLKEDGTDNDDQIQLLITAARLEAEEEYGRELPRKQYKLVLDEFPRSCRRWQFDCAPGRTYTVNGGPDFIELLDPLWTIDEVKYRKLDGSSVVMTAVTDYFADTDRHPGVLCPAPSTEWPTDDLWPSSAVQIKFTAGFDPAMYPKTIKLGMMLLVSQWYNGRLPFEETRFVAELPFHVTSCFRNGKLWRF